MVWARTRNKFNCRRKVRHNSMGAARAHVRALLKLDGDTGLHAYACHLCLGFHVGHERKKRIKRKK